jgi:hypothetical protein
LTLTHPFPRTRCRGCGIRPTPKDRGSRRRKGRRK